MENQIIWIFCLSCDKQDILEDTEWNIQAGMEYIRKQNPEDIRTILLVGDIHLQGKNWTVPERMLAYIHMQYPWTKRLLKDKFILESASLTSRENIPLGIQSLYDRGIDPLVASHVLCSENLHTQILAYLLRYHLKQYEWGGTVYNWNIQRMPSVQKILGWKGRLRRLLQQVDVRLDPEGKSPWYQWKRNQRATYRTNQT